MTRFCVCSENCIAVSGGLQPIKDFIFQFKGACDFISLCVRCSHLGVEKGVFNQWQSVGDNDPAIPIVYAERCNRIWPIVFQSLAKTIKSSFL